MASKKGFNMANRMAPQSSVLIPTSEEEANMSEAPSSTDHSPVGETVTVKGLYPWETRFTLIADKDLVEAFYNIAYYKRLKIKDAADEMLKLYLDNNPEASKVERPNGMRRKKI